MNAKKIMGAVLVALLAAALFVGAGAAETINDLDGKTVYVYQNVSSYGVASTVWYNEDGESVAFNAQGVIEQKDVKEGKYSYNDTISITVTKPTVKITATGVNEDKTYPVTGDKFYYTPSSKLTLNILSPAGGNITDLLITLPYIYDGKKEWLLTELLNESESAGFTEAQISAFLSSTGAGLATGKATFTLDASNPVDRKMMDAIFGNVSTGIQTGLYKVQGVFSNDGSAGNLTAVTPENLLIGKDVLTFTVSKLTDSSITASVDSVVVSSSVTVTMTGVAGNTYYLDTDGDFTPIATGITAFTPVTNDLGNYSFAMPNTGEIQITVKAINVGDAVLTLKGGEEDKTVEIEILEGSITAAADAESYYIGNDVTITGTATGFDEVYFHIAGTNKEFQDLTANNKEAVKNGEFDLKVSGDFFQYYDAGTYTVYVSNNDALNVSALETYTTVALVLKQPFISVTDAPSVAVKGTEYVVNGTAEAATQIYAYVFGTNYFKASNASSATEIDVNVKDNAFTIKVRAAETDKMDAGQYFMVIQHPMYDEVFNIYPNVTEIKLVGQTTALFEVDERQKANAAEALCQALDTQNIDDMYVKLSFVVAAAQSVINPIPETVAQGEKLTVSGSTNMGKGQIVTVEMLSTAFAAVPKETVGSAAFVSLTTKTDENGNWEVTFDTSGLNVDEYTVSAAVEQLGTATAKVNVVEAAPEQPDQPDVPGDEPEQPGDEPVAPETPGFGALAALAGLGAVAVLLLRRE